MSENITVLEEIKTPVTLNYGDGEIYDYLQINVNNTEKSNENFKYLNDKIDNAIKNKNSVADNVDSLNTTLHNLAEQINELESGLESKIINLDNKLDVIISLLNNIAKPL